MLPSFGRCTVTSWLTKKIEVLRQIRAAGSDEGPNGVPASGTGLHGEHEERRGETSGPSRIRQMGKKASQGRQRDGRLSLLPILTERKVGASRFPSGWRQVANRPRLASGSAGRLESRHR